MEAIIAKLKEERDNLAGMITRLEAALDNPVISITQKKLLVEQGKNMCGYKHMPHLRILEYERITDRKSIYGVEPMEKDYDELRLSDLFDK